MWEGYIRTLSRGHDAGIIHRVLNFKEEICIFFSPFKVVTRCLNKMFQKFCNMLTHLSHPPWGHLVLGAYCTSAKYGFCYPGNNVAIGQCDKLCVANLVTWWWYSATFWTAWVTSWPSDLQLLVSRVETFWPERATIVFAHGWINNSETKSVWTCETSSLNMGIKG